MSCSVSPSERKKAFHRAFANQDFDITELSASSLILAPTVWSYGVPDNRKELEAMFRYSVEQGLAPRKIELEEFFAPGTLHRWQGKD